MARSFLLAALALLALAACSAPAPSPTSPAPAAASRVTEEGVYVAFPRTLQAARMVEAQVHTVRDADVLVSSARLVSPLFADSPARDGEIRLFPDWTNHVRLFLGTPVCPAPGGATTVVLTMTVDGVPTTETLVADDTELRQINAEECAEQAVLDVATPTFGPVESQTTAELHTTIVLARGTARTDEPVVLDSMTGNIVFIIRLEPDAPTTLAPGEASLSVPAVVSVGRCDPHVFAESKKTFVFPLHMTIGDDEASYVEIQPDPTTQAALQQLFDDCGDVRNG
jgi:hypothetical protein